MRTAPSFACGITGASISNATSTSFARSAEITAGLPLYGTMVASRPAIDLNISADRFCVLPTLIVPMLSLPGFAFA